MQILFQELLAEVKRVNPSVAATLRPGLPLNSVRVELANLPYRIAPEAASLYEWADGADGPFQLLPGAYFIPLQQAMEEFNTFHAMNQELDEIFPQKYRECFRFLSDGSDGGYAFGRIDSPSKGRIVSMCIHAEWLIGFQDLEHLLKTSVECYRQGIMRSGDDLPDVDAFFKLAARLNPGLKAWQT
jgi:hypothetical protein